jgi:hypothetical protein
LRTPGLHFRPFAFLHHSSLEPFLDQSQNAGVGDAMLHELGQPTVIEIIEGHHDTLPTSRTYLSTSGLLARSTRSTEEHWRFLGDGVISPL